jgi:hypothetical protein
MLNAQRPKWIIGKRVRPLEKGVVDRVYGSGQEDASWTLSCGHQNKERQSDLLRLEILRLKLEFRG